MHSAGTEMSGWGLWSLLPLAVTLILAFVSRSALIAMLIGVFIGTLMIGALPGVGLNELLQSSLGNSDFIWICEIVILIGILFEGFKRSGVLLALAERFGGATHSPRRAALTAWGLGFLIIDDYFSPLMTGAVVRPMSDRAGMPREKLAFILDATTASVCILVPFTAWGAYMASLIAAQGGPVTSAEEGLRVFIGSIGYNFYPLLILCFSLLVCLRVIPDFGPMRRAEQRAAETGALVRPGANPLLDSDNDLGASSEGASLLSELALPVALVVGIGVGSLVIAGSVQIVEAFMAGVVSLVGVLLLRRRLRSASEIAALILDGARSVMPALLIVALAYALNTVAGQLGVGEAIVAAFSGSFEPGWLVPLTFVITAAIGFSTGTSWGAFAMMMPVAVPVAYAFSSGELTPIVYQTIAAVAGGGIFGDHASPVSDTTVLASLGAGSDHMDHVITQLPYALLAAALTTGLYLLL
ncbi:MAG: Na+/H+ antiporter NhaC family protein [Pseudomonadales bacterium]